MSRLIGRGRYARETYPAAGATGALVALVNRYRIAAVSPGIPSAFTVTTPTTHIVAAVNVKRRASGIFAVSFQMPATLGAADTQAWAAIALFGATASGGIANGDWLQDTGATITTAGATGASPMGIDEIQSGAGNLHQTVTLVGTNAAPVPQGSSTIIIAGTTVGGSAITPTSSFIAVAYELP